MGFFSKEIKTMDDLFVHTLQDIYYAEKQIVQSLPEMIDKATDPQLKRGFQAHLGESKNHVATGVSCCERPQPASGQAVSNVDFR
jgi:ferritin-like metal-binding protein YciE